MARRGAVVNVDVVARLLADLMAQCTAPATADATNPRRGTGPRKGGGHATAAKTASGEEKAGPARRSQSNGGELREEAFLDVCACGFANHFPERDVCYECVRRRRAPPRCACASPVRRKAGDGEGAGDHRPPEAEPASEAQAALAQARKRERREQVEAATATLREAHAKVADLRPSGARIKSTRLIQSDRAGPVVLLHWRTCESGWPRWRLRKRRRDGKQTRWSMRCKKCPEPRQRGQSRRLSVAWPPSWSQGEGSKLSSSFWRGPRPKRAPRPPPTTRSSHPRVRPRPQVSRPAHLRGCPAAGAQQFLATWRAPAPHSDFGEGPSRSARHPQYIPRARRRSGDRPHPEEHDEQPHPPRMMRVHRWNRGEWRIRRSERARSLFRDREQRLRAPRPRCAVRLPRYVVICGDGHRSGG